MQDPQALQDHVKVVMLQGWAESTRASYGAGLLVFHMFCDSQSIPEHEQAPASSNLISMFISALAGSYSAQAIQNYTYGVCAWHTVNGLPWTLHEDQISTMLKGTTKLAPSTAKQDKRQPVTTAMICAIKEKLTPEDPLDTAFFACLTTLFYSAAHVGEFTLKRLNVFNPVEHISPAHV